jgi:hypothetical protein
MNVETAMEQMTLLDFMTHFYNSQTKEYLINELIRHEVALKDTEFFRRHWEMLADRCFVEIVNTNLDVGDLDYE